MERSDIFYNEIETQIINELRSQALSQFKVIDLVKTGKLNNNDLIEKYKNKSIIHLNQEKTAYKVINHFEHPRNVGTFDKGDAQVGTGLVGAPACG